MFLKMEETVLKQLGKFQSLRSNSRFHSVLSLDLHTVKYVPLGSSSYIPLPKFLAAKKAIINLKNEDNECFKLALARTLNTVENKTLNILIKNFEKNQWSSIGMVWNFQSIWMISINLNDNSSISVNVIGYEKAVYPLRISKHNYKRESTVNILLISDNTKQHYCLIKDISKLLSLQTSKDGHVRHVCFRSLNTF